MAASRSRLGVIFLTVLIDLIGFGIIMPILPLYAQRFGAQGIGYGALVFIFSAMQFVATALLGRLSDRIGRRPILLTTMVFNAAGYVLFALAPSYALLFVARVISGFASGNISAAQAYVADITSPAERARGMGTIGAAFGIGFVLGPMIGGLADHYLGHLAPGIIAAAVQGFLFGRLERHTGARALLIVGLFGMAASIAAVPYATSSLQLYALTVPLAFANSLFAPAASGLVSIYADPTEQGTILGAAQAFAALGRSFGPLVAGWAYDGLGQRTTFFLAGAVMLLGGVAGLRLRKAGGVALSRSS